MKYLCFCYYDTKKFATLSEAEMEAIGPNCQPHDAALRAAGNVFAQGSLSLPQTWKCALPKNGKPVVIDGPYSQADRQVGAFIILEAQDMDEAMHVASKHAAANYGEHLGFAVEVRACEMFEWDKHEATSKT